MAMLAEPLTRALGGRWHGRYGTARCPAHDDSRPSLSIGDGVDGKLLIHCHAGCDFGDVLAAVRDICHSFGPQETSRSRSAAPVLRQSVSRLVSLIWSQAVAIEGTHAERYLRSRFITAPLPASLKCHRRLRHPTGAYLPAMVGKIEHVRDGFVALHRTYLDADQPRKTTLDLDKAMLGPCKGGAVHLRCGRQGLAVCEGIETALSLATGLDDGIAVWAALSTSGVQGLVLPVPSKFGSELLIGTDGDAPGRRAGRELADRATVLGWSVEVVTAPDGKDFNDLLGVEDHG